MGIEIKKADHNLLDEYCRVEVASYVGVEYLRDVYDYFVNYTVGDFSTGYIDGELAGIGKLSRLYDGSAWLETLRVDKQHQGKGLGNAFYKHFRKEAETLKCPVMRMYTSEGNAVSKGLAQINGFKTVAAHRGMFLDNPGSLNYDLPDSFRLASPMEAVSAWKDYKEGFVCLNRTFYEKNPDTYAGMGAEGRAFIQGSTALILGARFQRNKGLHMANPIGDVELALRFAIFYTAKLNLPKLTCTFDLKDKGLEKMLTSIGFRNEPYTTIVMEGKV
ncbi:MAG: GNAT family N-acetyltransferase [Treponema sp.]|nr:GNAT family N-acetyltransferase [Treponema sp.]